MKPIKVHKFWLERFAETGEPIGFCLPATAANSTVLGYEVSHRSTMWRNLDWSRVRIDSGPHLFHGEDSEYMHVDFLDASMGGEPERLSYRVRSRLRIGDKVKICGVKKRLTITDISVDGFWDGKWQWGYYAGDPDRPKNKVRKDR